MDIAAETLASRSFRWTAKPSLIGTIDTIEPLSRTTGLPPASPREPRVVGLREGLKFPRRPMTRAGPPRTTGTETAPILVPPAGSRRGPERGSRTVWLPLSVQGDEEVTVPFKTSSAVAALLVGLAAPAPAWAWGVPGCINLPEYERALGALQGMTGACDMSVEEANRIVAAHGNVPGGLFGALLSGPPRPVAETIPLAPAPQSRPPRRLHRVHHVVRRHEAVIR